MFHRFPLILTKKGWRKGQASFNQAWRVGPYVGIVLLFFLLFYIYFTIESIQIDQLKNNLNFCYQIQLNFRYFFYKIIVFFFIILAIILFMQTLVIFFNVFYSIAKYFQWYLFKYCLIFCLFSRKYVALFQWVFFLNIVLYMF